MILSVLEGHSPMASLFKCDISYLWRVVRSLCICRAYCHCNHVRLFTRSGSTLTSGKMICVKASLLLYGKMDTDNQLKAAGTGAFLQQIQRRAAAAAAADQRSQAL